MITNRQLRKDAPAGVNKDAFGQDQPARPTSPAPNQSAAVRPTDSWAVVLAPGSDPNAVAAQLGYRNMGIFYENAVNRILDDIVKATSPLWAELEGSFTTRGGMCSTITARHPRGGKKV